METERLLFKAIEKNDLELKTKWINDSKINEALFFRFPVSLEDTYRWYERVIKDPGRKDFTIIEKETSKKRNTFTEGKRYERSFIRRRELPRKGREYVM